MRQVNPPENRRLVESFQELMTAVVNLARSELKLMRIEVKTTIQNTARDTVWVGIFIGFALLGTLPFLSFLIIGLGKLLDDNYWLSSLIVSLFFFVLGSFLAFRMYKKLRSQDLTLPRTRESLRKDSDLIKSILQEEKPIENWRKVS